MTTYQEGGETCIGEGKLKSSPRRGRVHIDQLHEYLMLLHIIKG